MPAVTAEKLAAHLDITDPMVIESLRDMMDVIVDPQCEDNFFSVVGSGKVVNIISDKAFGKTNVANIAIEYF